MHFISSALELKQSCHNAESLAPLELGLHRRRDVITRAIKTLFIVEKELQGNDEDEDSLSRHCTVVDSAAYLVSARGGK